ncbi:hypothetical protein [Planococcus salinus]|uniref:Uncharacterized protein n=1 Tax=Planococcus salinus TaxID=1848460 RepID=A0A3M8P572_9BACL|nr:hypothetical protein [Planococcus salinus]RNF38819.1 hypothetical protein EEX84_11895 [Planococcus salinus]
MEQHQLIHTYTKPPRETFWRIAYIVALLVGALFGAWLVTAPIYYFLKYQNEWILISFVFIPLGIWIVYRLVRHLRKLMWEDSHLSSYTLYNHKIHASEWVEPYSKAPVEREIPLAEITSVTASFYVIRQTIPQHGFNNTVTETGPILYIRYTRNSQENVLNLPFPNHGDDSINVWLGFFKKAGIPLRFTAHTLYRADTQSLTDAQRLEYFDAGNAVIDFPFTGSWLADEAAVRPTWEEKAEAFIAEEEERNPEFKKARQKHTYKTWIPTIWLTAMVIMLLSYGYTKIGGNLPLSPGNILPGLVIFTMGGFLFFFCLRHYLRWLYVFTYWGAALIIGLWIAVATVEQPPIEAELGTSIFLAAIVYPLLMWLPFVAVKRWSKKKSREIVSV